MSYISEIRKKVGNDSVFLPCAGALIVRDGKVLLQKRSDDHKWAMHGGSLELGETFEEALHRELKEELGIEVVKARLLEVFSGKELYHVYPNGDQIYCILGLFLVEDFSGEITVDKNEVLEVRWFDINDLPDNLMDADIYPITKGLSLIDKG